MTDSAHYTQAAFFQETTSGTGPANAAAWISSGVRVAPVRGSIDVSGIGEDIVDDERARERIYDEMPGVHGIDNPEFPSEWEFEINGVETSDTSAITQTAQMQLLTHVMGGQLLGTSTTASGTHSTTTVEMVINTGCDEGTFLAVELGSYSANVLACHLRRVTDLTALVATVDQAFPNAPVDTDEVHAVAQIHVDPSVLIDSAAGDTTLSWLLQRGPTGGSVNWETIGCKSQLDSIELTRGEIAKFVLTTFGGSSTDPSEAPSPAWTSEPTLQNPVVVGPDTQVWMEDVGTTTNTLIDCASFNVTPGIPVSRDELITTNTAGMIGTGGYTTRTEATMIELACTFAVSYWNDFDANTLKVLRFSTLRASGQNFGIHFSRCQITKVHAVEEGDTMKVQLTLKALEDTFNSSAGDENLHRSKMTILYY